MSLAKKLQLPEGEKIRVINLPRGLKHDLPATEDSSATAVLVFVKDSKELKSKAKPAFAAASKDWLAWIAYPKAGQLDTDLNRDKLWERVKAEGIRPVRQVSIDGVWSAVRFRPS
jgi:hypothetical protein